MTAWARGLTALGVLIMIYGVVDIVWSQFGVLAEFTNVADRVTLAATGVLAIGIGALVVIGAEILVRSQYRASPSGAAD